MMKKVLHTFSMILLCISIFGQTKNFIDKPYLETSVRYDTLVTPDKITLSIDLDESDVRGKQTVKALEGKMYVTLEEIGINLNEQLSIADLSSNLKNTTSKEIVISKEDLLNYSFMMRELLLK